MNDQTKEKWVDSYLKSLTSSDELDPTAAMEMFLEEKAILVCPTNIKINWDTLVNDLRTNFDQRLNIVEMEYQRFY